MMTNSAEHLNLLKTQIENLKIAKNAIIMAHYYQSKEIQDIADFIGDSLALAQQAVVVEADVIVLCGVHFMGETAKLLNPGKTVLVPDINAGCSLAESCDVENFKEFITNHPGHKVVTYVNTTAEVKSVSDVVVTSSNAKLIIDQIPMEQPIIFGPDKNLGNYLNSVTGRNMVLWDGACHVHEKFSLAKILELKKQFPDSYIIAHPECKKNILLVSDFIGSTAALLEFVKKSDKRLFIVATESGILHQMVKFNPDKIFIPAPPNDSSCACNDCEFMKMNTLEKVISCLEHGSPEIVLTPSLMEMAVKPIQLMLEWTRNAAKTNV